MINLTINRKIMLIEPRDLMNCENIPPRTLNWHRTSNRNILTLLITLIVKLSLKKTKIQSLHTPLTGSRGWRFSNCDQIFQRETLIRHDRWQDPTFRSLNKSEVSTIIFRQCTLEKIGYVTLL